MSLQRVIISGGGTGGHIYPAIAIAEALQRHIPQIEILFVGAEGKMEMEKVPKAGYSIVGLPIRGWQRGKWRVNVTSLPWRIVASLWKAYRILRQFRPDAVIGTGGYASIAIGQLAAWMGVPLFLQEQNAFAGFTNRLLGKYARKICVAYPMMEKFFPKDRIALTGNPVRQDLHCLDKLRLEAAKYFGLNPESKTIFVMGGSLGANTINQAVLKALPKWMAAGYQLIWQTGKAYYESLQETVPSYQGLYMSQFIYQIPYAYALADVVVSRGGAISISEICIAGKPCILVPSPNVAEDHQTHNVETLASRGAAIVIKDNQVVEQLGDVLLELLSDKARQESLIKAIKNFARPTAADEIAKLIINEVEKLQVHAG
ncbi:MAG: undecaprenyldiphospho-muramoylpentapeptide beta-N-acetylglucosaminyltransferase [Cytophagales bacterium]|nr:undecaprenyldiphospho-muramoylpentapeptide beta-N-acetylglucosaminyltransferase [Bernardetiaceae bacterium]MDW8211675.1 undecaprenyldiphospho-muramoylpentapeptide beta-N-acetylglucosaminyltransferase [Cytophagales bacterium]